MPQRPAAGKARGADVETTNDMAVHQLFDEGVRPADEVTRRAHPLDEVTRRAHPPDGETRRAHPLDDAACSEPPSWRGTATSADQSTSTLADEGDLFANVRDTLRRSAQLQDDEDDEDSAWPRRRRSILFRRRRGGGAAGGRRVAV
jgi:hypothetical protein